MKTKYGSIEFALRDPDHKPLDYVDEYLVYNENIKAGLVFWGSEEIGYAFLGNGDVPFLPAELRNIADFLQRLNEAKK